MDKEAEIKISVRIGRTINMGNFNSLRVDAGLEKTIPATESYSAAYSTLWNIVNKEINKALAVLSKDKTSEVLNG